MAKAIIQRVKMTDEERRIAKCESSKKWYHANKESAQAAHAIWLANNKEKTKASHKKWLMENKEAVQSYVKARYHANPERFKAIAKEWFHANKARSHAKTKVWQDANPEKKKASTLAWRLANPDRYRVYDATRRARKLESGGVLSADLASKLFQLQRGKCACCGVKLGVDYHLDHIVPLRRGGSNCDSNMQLLTKKCNQQKHAKDPIDFMQSRGFLI